VLITASIYHGTGLDTSFLIDHLGSYLCLDPNAPEIDQHLVLGISLGGHAAWQVFFNEPRVTAAIVIIGCPDYMRMFSLALIRYVMDVRNTTGSPK
jgi:pimeloyl-ACP methyl ester carboxylesterase